MMKKHMVMAAFVALLIAIVASVVSAREITDLLGRRITIPDSPQRVVALAPSVTEIVFALGQGYRLKGATLFSDYPPEAGKLYKIGSYVKLDLERIVALQPDLCLATKDGNPKETVRRLSGLGIPVYVIDPRSLNTMLSTIHRIGSILNAEDHAHALVSSLQRRIDRAMEIVAGAERRPKVFIQIGISPIVSVGSNTFIHELIERAGGINLARGDTAYPRYSREQVLALAPEVLIITSMAKGGGFEAAKQEWSRWPGLPAAKNNRIHIENSDLYDRPSPRLVEGLERLVRLIHPTLFKEAP